MDQTKFLLNLFCLETERDTDSRVLGLFMVVQSTDIFVSVCVCSAHNVELIKGHLV